MIRFFNTYEPVTDFYRDLLPALGASELSSEVVISGAEYRPGRTPLSEAVNGHSTHLYFVRCGLSVVDSRARKIWASASYVLGALLRGLLGPRARLNFFLTQPPLFALAGPLLRALRGQPYCALVMDLYPQVLEADGRLSRQSLTYRLLQRLSRLALRRADRVFVIGRCMRSRLASEGVPLERISVIHNWSDESAIRPIAREHNPLAARFEIGEEFLVLYSGNMGVAHRFDTLLEVARRLANRKDIRFLLLGDGARRREIEREIQRMQLRNVQLAGFVSTAEMPYSQSLGDVHFVSLREAFTGLVVPSKAYSPLCAGRPMIYEGSPEGEIAQLINEFDVGRVVEPGDADALETAVTTLADDSQLRQSQGRRARNLATGMSSRSEAVRKYVEALRCLSGATHASAMESERN